MNIIQKLDNLILKLNESAELSWKEIQELCPVSTSFTSKTKKCLYRGSNNLNGKSGKETIANNRKPRDSNIEWHNLLNAAFKSSFYIPLRSTSLHCTGDESATDGYGMVYKIYPSDDFNFYWSNKISDLTTLSNFGDFLSKDYEMAAALVAGFLNCNLPGVCIYQWTDKTKQFLKNNLWKEFKDYVIKYEGRGYWENYVADAFEEGLRIDIGNNSSKFAEAILKKYPDCVNRTIRENYKKGNSVKDWVEAINSKNEIMVIASYYCYQKSNFN